jgi:amidohydrolase
MIPLDPLIAADSDYIADIRHDLHAHPELGYQEVRTSRVVTEELSKIGVEHVGGLAGGTGVLGYLPATTASPDEAPTIALRADMDALPVEELTGLPYASKHEGLMHACGHDGHTSVLLGTARLLSRVERPNNVLFVFQPAEEGGAGGNKMCEDGVLQGRVLGRPAERIFGLHGFPLLRVGEVATCDGAMLASADTFEIVVHGKGGHAAMPHTGIDPIMVASHIVVALQTVASRNVSPLDSVVVTVGVIEAGRASNIIPDTARIVGTLRSLKQETREFGQVRIQQIASSIAEAFSARTEIQWRDGYPVTYNDVATAAELRRTFSEASGVTLMPDVQPVMGAEDFSFYGRQIPACFYWLGLLNEDQESYPNLHAPEFDFNDRALPVGIRAMANLALATYRPTEPTRRAAETVGSL